MLESVLPLYNGNMVAFLEIKGQQLLRSWYIVNFVLQK